jgi:hypothetical protein
MIIPGGSQSVCTSCFAMLANGLADVEVPEDDDGAQLYKAAAIVSDHVDLVTDGTDVGR